MAYMIEISEDKVENLAEKVGKALRYMGEAMTCIDKMQSESEDSEEMGERRAMDYRDPYMQRAQWRNEGSQRFRDDGESYTPIMGERGGYRYGNRRGGR